MWDSQSGQRCRAWGPCCGLNFSFLVFRQSLPISFSEAHRESAGAIERPDVPYFCHVRRDDKGRAEAAHSILQGVHADGSSRICRVICLSFQGDRYGAENRRIDQKQLEGGTAVPGVVAPCSVSTVEVLVRLQARTAGVKDDTW